VHSWSRPTVPDLPGSSPAPEIFDTASARLVAAEATDAARLYVCGITPYDATHLGHAATYLAFDTLQRIWLDAGYDVVYVQNVTDVDDPLLERARDTGVDWRELAEQQTELFRGDMEALSILPPDDYLAVSEVVGEIGAATRELLDRGLAYRLLPDLTAGATEGDVYFDVASAQSATPWRLGEESNLDRETMLALFAERGGDPGRPGKRDALDPLLWRAARPGEPSWTSDAGRGRPGWHIECTVIALSRLGRDFTVQGGGSDLVFPHHEFSGGHATALTGEPFARIYSHAGMVAYEGEKMSKSLGNLVLVSRLREDGADPRAIRLALLAHHYREDWEWTSAELDAASARLVAWSAAAARSDGEEPCPAELEVLARLRDALHHDLDTPSALAVIDEWAAHGPRGSALVASAVDALLGVSVS
jgi:L-cysteine:1D-myo-inositol 2-amino-2-deoxy-alpha-D-glucopyranoside ligase